MPIYFYSTNDRYGEFSNFARYGIELDDLWWPTTEHYFQAQKFEDAAYRERIRAAAAPKLAAELGRSRELPLRADWERIKDDVMYLSCAQEISNASRTARAAAGDRRRGACRKRAGRLLLGLRQRWQRSE